MNRLLFRDRAQKVSRREATFGALPRNQGSGATPFMIGFLLSLVVTLLLGFVPLPDRVLLRGHLYEPKTLIQTAATSGQLQSFAVQVGDFVEAGKVIAYINPVTTSEEPALRRNSDFEALALQRQHQIQQQQQALLIGKLVSEVSLLLQQKHWRRTLINLEVDHLRQQQNALTAAHELFLNRFISAVEWQRMNAPLRVLASRIVEFKSELAGLSFRLASARANLKLAKLDAQQAEIKAQHQRQVISAETKQLDNPSRRTITANSSGRIVRRAAEPGDFVTPNMPVIELATPKPYYLVKLRIPKRIQTALNVGDALDVKLLTHLTPMDGSISGTIRDLAALSLSDSLNEPSAPRDLIATLRLPKPIITSTGKTINFIAGTPAQTWLVVSEKTLFERLAAMVSPAFGMRHES
ncbi:MAG: hypothetical protein P8I59_05215 [Pseudomonadales bacterium]|nr:hypothetical protein [Pseudomonadales bacterium]